MESNKKLKMLMNAEPFGFGPSAAISSFFPYLQNAYSLSYAGKNHTLDLQRSLPYEHIFDVSGLSTEVESQQLQEIMTEFDIIFTALDFEVAKIAKDSGKTVIMYDPLTWHWKDIPEVVKRCDLYLAQDFFDVRERVMREPEKFGNMKIIPPIVTPECTDATREYVLLNLGGLANPVWDNTSAFEYAKAMISIIKPLFKNDTLLITTSRNIASQLNDTDIKTLDRCLMKEVLKKSKCAFMTPGLGNIFDAASYNIPTIWLPPANDSQGQQLTKLISNGVVDGTLHWHGAPINYYNEQVQVLKEIALKIYDLSENPELLTHYKTSILKQISNIGSYSKTAELLKIFGSGGDKLIGSLLSR